MRLGKRFFSIILVATMVMASSMISMAEDTVESNVTSLQVYLDEHCKCQTPEAKDDYVSVLADMPKDDGVSVDQVLNELSVKVAVGSMNGTIYDTKPMLDEDDEEESIVFTTVKKLPKLAENKKVYVIYDFADSGVVETAGADKIEEVTVGAEAKNPVYERKTLTNIKVTPKVKSYKYSGSYNKPKVTVTAEYKGKTIPASALSYDLSYSKSKNVGIATVTVTMNGDYAGEGSATYTINPIGTSIDSVTSLSKGFKINWKAQNKKMSTFNITGYQIQYSTDKSFPAGQNTKTVASNYGNTSKKISKLKTKKKYYVRVRTYKTLYGKKYYSGWTKAKVVTTK